MFSGGRGSFAFVFCNFCWGEMSGKGRKIYLLCTSIHNFVSLIALSVKSCTQSPESEDLQSDYYIRLDIQNSPLTKLKWTVRKRLIKVSSLRVPARPSYTSKTVNCCSRISQTINAYSYKNKAWCAILVCVCFTLIFTVMKGAARGSQRKKLPHSELFLQNDIISEGTPGGRERATERYTRGAWQFLGVYCKLLFPPVLFVLVFRQFQSLLGQECVNYVIFIICVYMKIYEL